MLRMTFAAGLLAALFTGSSVAATVITLAAVSGQHEITQTMYLDSDRLWTDSPAGGMLYRSDLGKVFIVDNNTKSYVEQAPKDVDKNLALIEKGICQSQQEVAAIAKSQRKCIEKTKGPQSGKPIGKPSQLHFQISYEKTGALRKTGTWDCTPVNQLSNGKAIVNYCIGKLSDLGLNWEDLKPYIDYSKRMNEQIARLNGQASSMNDLQAISKFVGYDGFPIFSAFFTPTGQIFYSSTLISVEHKDIPTARFEIPAGYVKHELQEPAHGGP